MEHKLLRPKTSQDTVMGSAGRCFLLPKRKGQSFRPTQTLAHTVHQDDAFSHVRYIAGWIPAG
jgi:hypothetical protein